MNPVQRDTLAQSEVIMTDIAGIPYKNSETGSSSDDKKPIQIRILKNTSEAWTLSDGVKRLLIAGETVTVSHRAGMMLVNSGLAERISPKKDEKAGVNEFRERFEEQERERAEAPVTVKPEPVPPESPLEPLEPVQSPLFQARKNDRTLISGLGFGECFVDYDGHYGFAEVDPIRHSIHVRTADEWEEYTKGMSALVNQKAMEVSGFYALPGKPDVDHEDKQLLTDIIRVAHPIVEFPGRDDLDESKDDGQDSRFESVFASFTVGSYLTSYTSVNPRIGLSGTTGSGKGRAQACAKFMCYHALSLGSPTPPVMFRAASWYKCTLALDEIQDFKTNKDRMTDLLDILKLGFDGTPIGRIGPDGSSMDLFDTNTCVLYSVKNWIPPEDVLNRSIFVTMTKHRRWVEPDTPKEDRPEFMDLRARLTALELRIAAGLVDYEAIKKKAAEWTARPIVIEGQEHRLEDRAAEIGRTLIAACIAAGGDDENIEDIRQVLMASSLEASESLRESFEGRVFLALQAVVKQHKGQKGVAFSPEDISTIDVKDQLNADLTVSGNAGREEVKTRPVTEALKVLGFKLQRGGTGNRTFLKRASFERIYALNLDKIGARSVDQ